jgi:hypothetical protein
MPPKAQKHVTHNETLLLLDAVAQLTIAGLAAAPPQSQAEGACYLIDAAASGAWAGKSGPIAGGPGFSPTPTYVAIKEDNGRSRRPPAPY